MAPFIELGVGFNSELTARDNVLINAIMLGLTPAEARARYEDIIAFAELEQFVDLKLKNYSSGMHVRLAFAVMVQVDADVLLIDEVLAVGDAAFQQKCHDTLQEMRDEGRTILLVTHDMSAVERFCDRAMLLERGELVMLGEPHEVAVGYNEMNFGRSGGGASAAGADRRGDGAARVLDAWFEDRDGNRAEVLEQGTPCSVRMLVEAQEPLEDPVCGFSINDDQHRRVFATATAWVGQSTGTFAAGDRAVVTLQFDTVFHPGRYSVTPFVAYRGSGDRMMDLRERLISVVVTGTLETGGVVDLPHDARRHARRHRDAARAGAAVSAASELRAGPLQGHRPLRAERRLAALHAPLGDARRHRLQAALLRLGAGLPVEPDAAAADVRRAVRRLQRGVPLRRRREQLPGRPADGDRRLRVLRRGDRQRRAVGDRPREPRPQDPLPADGDPALDHAHRGVQPRPQPRRRCSSSWWSRGSSRG